MKWNRLPAGPLLALVPERSVATPGGVMVTGAQSELSRILDVQPKVVWQWKRDGLDEYVADRVAYQLGYHPTDIWGDLWRIVCVEPEPEPDRMFAGRPWWDGYDLGACAEDCDALCRVRRRRLIHRADNARRRLRERSSGPKTPIAATVTATDREVA